MELAEGEQERRMNGQTG